MGFLSRTTTSQGSEILSGTLQSWIRDFATYSKLLCILADWQGHPSQIMRRVLIAVSLQKVSSSGWSKSVITRGCSGQSGMWNWSRELRGQFNFQLAQPWHQQSSSSLLRRNGYHRLELLHKCWNLVREVRIPFTSCVWPLRSCVGCRLNVLHVHTKIFVKIL